MKMFSLDNKVIIVTGATGVLGEAFVSGLATAGAKLVLIGRKLDIAQQRADEVNANGGEAIAAAADVLDEAALTAIRDQVLAKWGRIDGLVNGAGGNMPEAIIGPNDDLFGFSIDGMRKAFDLNLFGTILPTRIFGEVIVKNGGSIVNISSMAAGQAITRVLGYSMAKAAVDNFTKWMSTEMSLRFGDKVRMNAIAPGFFVTHQNRALLTNTDGTYTERGGKVINNTPAGRFGNPDELIGALVWLLSDASVFVNGQVINVDGGFSIYSGV
ncbi:SDR family oxidoreductase [uncultured Chitinophaga sp.]|uniref:SDR family oxidoreductase n=1 Tax=uncultured Chitinophaga sp. TaxID=339340 RepID=UPI0025D23094|nr:SDR family oxidoreductase [uncultured Chitinophaga sp.]